MSTATTCMLCIRVSMPLGSMLPVLAARPITPSILANPAAAVGCFHCSCCKHPADCKPNWTPLQVCQNGYTLSSGSDELDGDDFDEEAGTVTFFKDSGYLTGLRNEKAARVVVISQHAQAADNGAAAYTQCMDAYQQCNGQGRCNFGACVAEKLQYSW